MSRLYWLLWLPSLLLFLVFVLSGGFFYLLALALLGALIMLWGVIADKAGEFRCRNRRCPHGMKGGQTQDLCSLCREELQLRREREERKARIRLAASTMRIRELERIRGARFRTRDYLLSLSPEEFENVVAELFRKLGHAVKQTARTGDRGRDAITEKEGRKYVVECKRYAPDKSLGRPHLQKLFAAMSEERAAGAFLVTTAKFARTGSEYAQKNRIELVDLDHLLALMRQAYPESDDHNVFRVICEECGAVHTFALTPADQKRLCGCGATVLRPLTENDLSLRRLP